MVLALPRSALDDEWPDVRAWLPPDLDRLARETGVLTRKRVFTSGADLVRLALGYAAFDRSLHECAAWATMTWVPDYVSDVAVLKRLGTLGPFLGRVLGTLLDEDVRPPTTSGSRRVWLPDLTVTDRHEDPWHEWTYGVRYATEGTCAFVSKRTASDSLAAPWDLQPDDVVVLYPKHPFQEAWIAAAADGRFRLVSSPDVDQTPVFDPAGKALSSSALEWRRGRWDDPQPRVLSQEAALGDPHGNLVPARLIRIQRTDRARAAACLEWRHAHPDYQGLLSSRRTIFTHHFILTTLPVEDEELAVDLVRLQHQVGRLIPDLSRTRPRRNMHPQKSDLQATYMLARLLAARLAERLALGHKVEAPWGLPLRPPGPWDFGRG